MMKKFIWILAFVFFLTLVIWWLSNPQGQALTPIHESKKTQSAPRSQTNLPIEVATNAYLSEIHARLKEIEKDHHWDWKRPITFYGKVVDENNQPVEKVHVKFDWNDLSRTGTSYAETVSDAKGLFSLTGVKGKILGVQPEKEGYYTSITQNHFSFEYADPAVGNYHRPNANQPVIFHLRKKREAEPLVHFEKRPPIDKGNPVTLDIIGKSSGSNGQVQLTLLDNAINPPRWAMRFSVPEGGIITTDDEFPTTAPESGYQHSVELDMSMKNPPRWEGVYKGGRFYVHTREGYGLVEIKMVPGNEYFRVISFFNPSGSRNLEYDPAKQLNP